jgi:phosphatidate cytidylyltransferase
MKPEENKFADVPLRVKTWIYIIIVFALGISHPLAMAVFTAWIGLQSFFEFSKMFKVPPTLSFHQYASVSHSFIRCII